MFHFDINLFVLFADSDLMDGYESILDVDEEIVYCDKNRFDVTNKKAVIRKLYDDPMIKNMIKDGCSVNMSFGGN